MLGVSFMMYALVLEIGDYGFATGMTGTLMYLAWDISGGHFNPAITLGIFMANLKDGGKNLVIMLVMIVAQFAGAFLGLLWAWLALCDYTWKDRYNADHSIPTQFYGVIAPKSGDGSYDLNQDGQGFTRDW